MDDLQIKTNAVRDAAPKPAGADNLTTLAGLAVSFQDLLHKAGIRIESGLYALADRAGIGAIAERAEAVRPVDDHRRTADDGRDRSESRDRADGNRADPARARQADRPDDSGRDHGAEHRASRGDTRGDDHGQSHADDHAASKGENGAGNRDASAADDRGDAQQSADAGNAGQTQAKAQNSGDQSETPQGQTGGQQAAAVAVGVDAAAAKAAVAAQVMNPLLAGLLADSHAQSTAEGPAKALEVVSQNGAQHMAQTAVENITKATPVATGQDNGAQDDADGRSQVQINVDANGLAKIATAGRSQHSADGNVKAATQTVDVQAANVVKPVEEGQAVVKPADVQAASLARMLGSDNRAQVNVSVNDDAQYLMSRPTATLTAGASLAADQQGQSASGQASNAHLQSGNANTAIAAQAQQAQAAAQSQGNQNAQVQAAAQTGADAKALAQVAAGSGNAGGTAHAGGGEAGQAITNTNAAQGAQQAQQAQQQAAAGQTKQAEQPVRNGHAVYEQVSVKIAKAINAGNDRITIQLRPANMGRVEVKMELTHDNRLMAVVTADQKDTLDILQRDARELQRALADAGLHTGSGDLQFNLRGQTGQGTDGDGKSAGRQIAADEAADAADAGLSNALFPPAGGIMANGRIDIRA